MTAAPASPPSSSLYSHCHPHHMNLQLSRKPRQRSLEEACNFTDPKSYFDLRSMEPPPSLSHDPLASSGSHLKY